MVTNRARKRTPTLVWCLLAGTVNNYHIALHLGTIAAHPFTDLTTEDIFRSQSESWASDLNGVLRDRGLSVMLDQPQEQHSDDDEHLYRDGSRDFSQPAYRQPYGPPEKPYEQRHEGFSRFLKQVASPPHNRVTAGGRIVPAGPKSPPTMLNFASIDDSVQRLIASLKSSNSLNSVSSSTKGSETFRSYADHSASVGTNRFNPSQNQMHQNKAASQIHSRHPNLSADSDVPTIPLPPLFPGTTIVAWLTAGDLILAHGGLRYRLYWFRDRWNLEGLQPGPPTILQTQYTTPYQYEPYGVHSFPSTLPAMGIEQGMYSGNPVNYCGTVHPNASPQARSCLLKSRLKYLESELKTLDRYTALHLENLTADQNAQLFSMRKLLVEQIDQCRVTMSNLASHSMMDSDSGSHVHQQALASHDVHIPNTPPPSVSTLHRKSQTNGTLVKNNVNRADQSDSHRYKCLSPEAAPFIPKRTSSAYHISDIANFQENMMLSEGRNGCTQTQDSNVMRHQSISRFVGDHGSHNSSHSFRTQIPPSKLEKEDENPNTSLLPAVTREQAEYVDRMGLNPANGQKLYCSTPEEFQEVIRRAREQATIYGCKGGSSKNPAFDAEDDIRWAMSECSPVPLPESIPDHISNPRPWSWSDSVFNVHSKQNFRSSLSTANLDGQPLIYPNYTKWDSSLHPIQEEENSSGNPDAFPNKIFLVKPNRYTTVTKQRAEVSIKPVDFKKRCFETPINAAHATGPTSAHKSAEDVQNNSPNRELEKIHQAQKELPKSQNLPTVASNPTLKSAQILINKSAETESQSISKDDRGPSFNTDGTRNHDQWNDSRPADLPDHQDASKLPWEKEM